MPDHTFWLAVVQVIGIDVLLSGDNAVVIALACRSLPPRQRRIGIGLGVGLALVLRIAAAAVIVFLLAIPFLKAIGGVLLFYIAVKVVKGESEEEKKASRVAANLLTAVGMIVMADIIMSLDNVVAIAGAANGDDLVFILGLLVSMPLMIVGASLITALIVRLPIVVWAGGALLGWIAGGMIVTDPYVAAYAGSVPKVAAEGLGGVVVLLAGAALWWWRRPAKKRRLA